MNILWVHIDSKLLDAIGARYQAGSSALYAWPWEPLSPPRNLDCHTPRLVVAPPTATTTGTQIHRLAPGPAGTGESDRALRNRWKKPVAGAPKSAFRVHHHSVPWAWWTAAGHEDRKHRRWCDSHDSGSRNAANRGKRPANESGIKFCGSPDR